VSFAARIAIAQSMSVGGAITARFIAPAIVAAFAVAIHCVEPARSTNVPVVAHASTLPGNGNGPSCSLRK